MVLPFIPWLIGAAGTGASHLVTKAADKAAEERKLEAAKRVLGVTPEQAEKLEARKGKSADEVEAHAALGIDVRQPLPEQASERAHEVHAIIAEARALGVPPGQLMAQKASKLTRAEEHEIKTAPAEQRDAVIEKIADKKARELAPVAQAVAAIEAGTHPGFVRNGRM